MRKYIIPVIFIIMFAIGIYNFYKDKNKEITIDNIMDSDEAELLFNYLPYDTSDSSKNGLQFNEEIKPFIELTNTLNNYLYTNKLIYKNKEYTYDEMLNINREFMFSHLAPELHHSYAELINSFIQYISLYNSLFLSYKPLSYIEPKKIIKQISEFDIINKITAVFDKNNVNWEYKNHILTYKYYDY